VTFIKRTLAGLLLLLLLLALAVFGVIQFVDPNQFKEPIERETAIVTGQVLKIHGPLSWKWFPILGLTAENVELKDAEPFKKTFFATKTANIECAFWSIFSGKILMNLTLKDFTLLLQRNSAGQTSWSNLSNRLSSGQKSSDSALPIVLNSIQIENGEIGLEDSQNNQYYTVNHLNLSASNLYKGLIGIPNAVALNFDIQDQKQDRLELSLQGNWSLKQDPKQIQLKNLQLKLSYPPKRTLLITGETVIQDFDSPTLIGQFATNDIDLKSWLQAFNITYPSNLPASLSVAANFNYHQQYLEITPWTIHLSKQGNLSGNLNLNLDKLSLKTLTLKGDIIGNSLNIGKLNLDQFKANFTAKEGLLVFSPITFQIAQSQQKATLTLDFRGQNPKYAMTEEGQSFELTPILAAFDIPSQLEGKTQIRLNLSAEGSTPETLRRTLSGQANVKISQGKLRGIDLVGLLKSTRNVVHDLLGSLIHKQITNPGNALDQEQSKWNSVSKDAFTPFDTLEVNLPFTNGIANHATVSMIHPEYRLQGDGMINTITETLQYPVSVSLQNNPYPSTDEIGNYLAATPIPVVIQGSLSDPEVRPNLKSYFDSAFQYAQQKLMKQVIDKTIDKAINRLFKIPQD